MLHRLRTTATWKDMTDEQPSLSRRLCTPQPRSLGRTADRKLRANVYDLAESSKGALHSVHIQRCRLAALGTVPMS